MEASRQNHFSRFHEDQWVTKGNRLPVSREMLMIALQGVQQILVRAMDASGATEAEIYGVTLDTAIPVTPTTISLRPALGIEQCACPSKYKSTSCQDPGIGFYRWYKEHYVTSEIIIDLIGDAKRCECNGRANKCHPETGLCLVS